MKKFFLASSAIVIAVSMIAFTAPTKKTTADFEFNGDPTLTADVTNPAKYVEASITCVSAAQEACRINGVSDVYWHLNGSTKVLNSNGNGDPGDQNFSITDASFTNAGLTTYYVTGASSSTSIVNQEQ